MAKIRQGFRQPNLIEPVEWKLRADQRLVFHQITLVESVETPDGIMQMARIIHRTELANPLVDIAGLVGQALVYRKGGVIDPQSPELWFWNDKFWVKARGTDGTDYYHQKCYLLYEVNVKDADKLMSEISTGFGPDEQTV
jgi:hypothetical protein